MLKLTVYGTPVGKGSMKCVGARGKVGHQLVASNLGALRPWSESLTNAVAKAAARGHRFEGPVGVYATITVPRPPSNRDLLPIRRSKGGDVDKQQRTLLDALTDGGLIRDDSQVVQVEAVTVFPDTPLLVDEDGHAIGKAGRLQAPGVVVFVYGVLVVCRECKGAGEIPDPNGGGKGLAYCPTCDGKGVES